MTQHLVEVIGKTRFLAVVGPSGSGKSSLVRAGLLPVLKAGGLASSDDWIYVTFTPSSHPLQELALSLARAEGVTDKLLAATQDLLNNLESDDRTLYLHARILLEAKSAVVKPRLLIFADQFEELFTLCSNMAERLQFIRNLRYAMTTADDRLRVVVTMRADFLDRAAHYTELAELLSGHHFVVSPMDTADLRRAIEEPARLAGLSFEDGLVPTILEDVGNESGTLPLLEDALLQLCNKRNNDNVMTLQAYQNIGGVHGSLSRRAENTYRSFSRKQRKAAQRVMLRLIRPGEGGKDTGRRAAIDELWRNPGERGTVEEVIRKLADARLLTTSTDADGTRRVEIAHEALIRGWPRLLEWIDKDRSSLRLHHQLTEAALEWHHRQDEGFLYRGFRLQRALLWSKQHRYELNRFEQRFLDASVAAEAKEQQTLRRLRWSIGVAAGALFILTVVAVSAIII